MGIERFRIYVGGKPVRLYRTSGAPACRFAPCEGIDEPYADEFATAADAERRATRWALSEYEIKPVQRDIGQPTVLTEIGF